MNHKNNFIIFIKYINLINIFRMFFNFLIELGLIISLIHTLLKEQLQSETPIMTIGFAIAFLMLIISIEIKLGERLDINKYKMDIVENPVIFRNLLFFILGIAMITTLVFSILDNAILINLPNFYNFYIDGLMFNIIVLSIQCIFTSIAFIAQRLD